MEYDIKVEERSPFPEAVYKVTIKEGATETKHLVTMHEPYYHELTAGTVPPEELVRKSIVFLLQREPKESILPKFELPKIQKYFQEYEDRAREGFPSQK